MLYLRHRMLKERLECLDDLVMPFGKLNDLRAIGLEPLEPCNSRILRNVDPSKSFAYLGRFLPLRIGRGSDMTTLNA